MGADTFDRFWNVVRDRLRPGGILVVNQVGTVLSSQRPVGVPNRLCVRLPCSTSTAGS